MFDLWTPGLKLRRLCVDKRTMDHPTPEQIATMPVRMQIAWAKALELAAVNRVVNAAIARGRAISEPHLDGTISVHRH